MTIDDYAVLEREVTHRLKQKVGELDGDLIKKIVLCEYDNRHPVNVNTDPKQHLMQRTLTYERFIRKEYRV